MVYSSDKLHTDVDLVIICYLNYIYDDAAAAAAADDDDEDDAVVIAL